MLPYFEQDGITIYCGDALDVLRDYEGTVDAIIADPPYCSGARQQSGSRAPSDGKMSRGTKRTNAPDWFGDTMGTESYIWWLRQLGRSLFAVAAPASHFYCFTDWRQYANVVVAFETVGWTLRTCIVWDKGDTGMGSFWRSSHEFIPVFSKGPARPLPHHSFFNVLRASKPRDAEHPTVKPPTLIRRLIEASGGATVLDPCLGSGTTLRAAADLGVAAVGIEIEERYCEIAAKRLQQEAAAAA